MTSLQRALSGGPTSEESPRPGEPSRPEGARPGVVTAEVMPGRILVVDDSRQTVEAMARFLELQGHQVEEAYDGVQALEKVRRDPPDLILLDVQMPRMDGFEVCARLKSNEETRLIPIVMITALGELDSKIVGLEAGADDYLTKPPNMAELQARVTSLLRMKRLNDQLERTEAVIFTLARAVEAKDPYTEGHLRRMADYSVELGQRIGLGPEDIQALRYGGILHDIGKIGVPEAILCKPGPLTAAEYREVKKHPAIGMRIVEPLRFAPRVAPIVGGHQEKWLGDGYPHGWAKENIPLGARIVAVVDAWDAMTTDRPYRQAMPLERVFEVLRQGAGKQWDPDLIPVFIEMMAEKRRGL